MLQASRGPWHGQKAKRCNKAEEMIKQARSPEAAGLEEGCNNVDSLASGMKPLYREDGG